MGKEYIQHSDLCGCDRCAAQADSDNPRPVYDVVENPDIYNCGCTKWDGCTCD